VKLTDDEWELLRFLSSGWTNRAIAAALNTTEHMIKNRLRTLYDRTGMGNRVELALWFVKHFPDKLVGTEEKE
jgi:DNA-binding NarL/FixJ family response regulator